MLHAEFSRQQAMESDRMSRVLDMLACNKPRVGCYHWECTVPVYPHVDMT